MAVGPSREELVEEARRRGIAEPEKLAPRELERLTQAAKPSPSFWSRMFNRVRGALGTEPPAPPTEVDSPPVENATDRSHEPIPTRTMAGLLAAQGHEERALAIYERLLSEEKDTTVDLETEVTSLRQRIDARAQRSAGRSSVVAVVSPRSGVLVAWNVPDATLRLARQQLDSDAALTARVVVIRPDAKLGATIETLEREGQPEGEWVIGTLPAGTRVTSSIGYRRGERFVSAAHSAIIEA